MQIKNRSSNITLSTIFAVIGTTLLSLPALAESSFAQLADIAAAETPAEANLAIASLRQQGPAGLEAFLAHYADKFHLDFQNQTSLNAALDTLCAQKDCYSSQLYWYTDLEAAKAASQATGKPILSLHLLGNLTDEFSCANSRFFRIALYPNREVSQYLRQNYILHWQSVRPAPRITIDFGDGRKLERTITGNSIHYILDSNGQPIDALPGLYGPQAFLKRISQVNDFVKNYQKQPAPQKANLLRQYHSQRLNEIQQAWQADFTSLGMPVPVAPINPQPSSPTALQAAPIAMTKMVVELPMLRSMNVSNQPLPEIDNNTWEKLAGLHTQEARLDSNSIALMQTKNPLYLKTENLQKVLANFQRNIALDTVRNEYLLHRQIHQWFIQGQTTANLTDLNERVYSELFLTPSRDPWLGLYSDDAYTGIANDGVIR